jgi:tetratricopeptide (TPR) repeat protein
MKNKRSVQTLIFCFFLAISAAKSQTFSPIAKTFHDRAIHFLKENQADSAQFYHLKARQLYAENQQLDSFGFIVGHFQLNRCKNGADCFDAVAALEKTIQNLPFQPISTQDWAGECTIYKYIGHIYAYHIGDFLAASAAWQNAFDIFQEKMGPTNRKTAEYIYHQLANSYTRLGDYPRAESILIQSIEKGKAENWPELLDFGDLMTVFESQNRLDDALELVQVAHRSQLSPKYEAHVFAVETNVLLKKKEVERAVKSNENILPLLDKIAEPTDKFDFQCEFDHNLAKILVEKSDFNAAILVYQVLIQKKIDFYKTQNTRDIAKNRLEIAKIYQKINQLDSALLETHRAMLAVFPNFKNSDPFSIPIDAADFFAENTQMEALVAKSEVFEAMNRPDLAVECLEKVPIVWEKLRETYSFEASNLQAADNARHEMERGTRLAADLFFTKNDPKWAQKAFFFSEMARCQVLADGISKARAKTKLSPETQKRDQNLRSHDAYLSTKIRDAQAENNTEKLAELRADLLKNKRELELFEAEIEKSTPDFGRLNRKLPAPDADFLQKTKENGLAIADFFAAGDSLFLFFFPPNAEKWSIRRIEWTPDDQIDWNNFGEMCAHPTDDAATRKTFVGFAHYFFEKLLGDEFRAFGAAISRLKIMPDAALAGVPFELFCTEKRTADVGFRQMPWLLKKCAISYEGSTTLFLMAEKQLKNSENRLDYTGFAPKYNKNQANPNPKSRSELTEISRDGSFDDLPGARKEIETGNSIFGGDVFFENATETTFKRAAGFSKILHLAMHALLNPQNPAFSALYFGEKMDEEDNFLYANELVLAENNTELAILSACRTGNGRTRPGEGTLSLGRAFALAGVPATVVSWWRLPDESTPEVIADFYKILKTGATKDAALRQAKLNFLATNPTFAHPFFWAGLVLVGDSKAIF